MSYPSVKRMVAYLGINKEQAKHIRRIMEGTKTVDGLTRLDRIDEVLGTCGVEYIPAGSNAKSPAIYYCNTGDSYGATVLKINGSFKLGSWADWVERGNYD